MAKSAKGGNKFNSRKNREEIQSQRKSKKLTMFMSFMDIFPVFDEFLPYFSSYLSHLMFFTQFHAKYWKIFGASRHLRLYFVQFCVKNGKFSALRAIWGFILHNFFVKNRKFLALRAIWNMLWRFSMVLAWKNREEIGIFWFKEGEKIGTYGQNIYPCQSILGNSNPPFRKGGFELCLSIINIWQG